MCVLNGYEFRLSRGTELDGCLWYWSDHPLIPNAIPELLRICLISFLFEATRYVVGGAWLPLASVLLRSVNLLSINDLASMWPECSTSA